MMQGRLLAFESFDAASNMSIDEAISLSVAAGEQGPTLRFYGWRKPTLSLGYFQRFAEAEAYLKSLPSFETANDSVDLVRRGTGGGAILHHREWTYSLSLPLADNDPGARETVYQSVHQSIRDSLSQSGVVARPFREFDQVNDASNDRVSSDRPVGLRKKSDERFLCFQRRTSEDLICHGYKILGSAQRRLRGGILQHGSLLLSVSPWADVLPGIRELTNVDLGIETFAADVTDCLERELGIKFEAGVLSDAENESAETIVRQRYAAAEWTRRR
ncbi:lipoate--protein ligase family protein [Neorhodopirellula pilleata]|uniref:Octanoyltransferase LipM n=1 Tax=Neorhodopirellula pilleata TaxID=2714738 RepID=A0A5C5ZZV4_9BACT|nr:biotin/lipoate A/B protein ligase family protein [Neorhodopirellula pilleata]TWT93102.1 Octanoyltransferase LipM [Neorhodopirellula pilleata]